ncbi:MAG: histidine phosphatase family protein [Anaerovibrio sp.]|uniref:histidine phosphatase family protein n=1 Tax=Anaerovibrio sp. TaxID=1872532 RepID=UPI0025F2ABE2|nr:histidine phosphatase family protein [Anaerovibrio sp.]MCR5175415.1 histidine phosphatase family protein [Anaerovibrio sp.]
MNKYRIFGNVMLGMIFLLCLVSSFSVQAKSTTVILVRHGQTDYNKQDKFQGILDIPLNETGLEQADMLADSIKDIDIDVFISSPMKRAYVTTEKCAQAKGMEISYTDPRLMEINYGRWAGKKKKDVAREEPEAYRQWNETPWEAQLPEGENLAALQQRYREALDDAVTKYPGKVIFIGAHSKGNMALICSILGIGLEHYNQLDQDNTCINVLQYKKGKWKLVMMNSISHLGKIYKRQKAA